MSTTTEHPPNSTTGMVLATTIYRASVRLPTPQLATMNISTLPVNNTMRQAILITGTTWIIITVLAQQAGTLLVWTQRVSSIKRVWTALNISGCRMTLPTTVQPAQSFTSITPYLM